MARSRADVFNADKFNKMLLNSVTKAHKTAVFTIFRGVVFRTPVDEGRARASWYVQNDSPSTEMMGKQKKLGKQNANQIALSRLRELRLLPFTKTYITNNLPYIVPLENGHSGQAPQGMVAITVAEYREGFGVDDAS